MIGVNMGKEDAVDIRGLATACCKRSGGIRASVHEQAKLPELDQQTCRLPGNGDGRRAKRNYKIGH
jgi:hypothetical protein